MTYQSDVSLYMKQVNKYPLLTPAEEKELGALALIGDKDAINKLIVSNLRFVIQVANKYRNYTKSGRFSILDLIQEGNDGLIFAANKYDVNKGYRFTTYAVWWIKARIMQFIIKAYSIVKVGTTSAERQLFFKIGYIKHLLEVFDTEERNKQRDILAETVGLSVTKIKKMEQRMSWDDVSLDARQTGDTNTYTLYDVVADEEELEDRVLKSDTQVKIKKVINDIMQTLTDREQDIMKRRWLREDGQTLQKIATAHGISRERIRQIESAIFVKMRRQLQNSTDGKEAIEAILR